MTGASYSLKTVAEPAGEPVLTPTAKLHCRVDLDAEDDLFDIWVPAARRLCEDESRRRFVTQTVRLTLPGWVDYCGEWPAGLAGLYLSGLMPADYANALRLPVEPVTAVTGIQYYATDGTLTTLAPGLYQTWLDHSPPLVLPAPGQSWPALQAGRAGAVLVTFTAGYGLPGDVPADAKNAVLLTVGYWYRNRGDGKDPAAVMGVGMPPGAKALLQHLSTGAYR